MCGYIVYKVRQQVEFLVEVVGSQPCAELLVLRSQCEGNISLLDKAVSLLRNSASAQGYGAQYLTALNPDLLLEIAQLYPHSVSVLFTTNITFTFHIFNA